MRTLLSVILLLSAQTLSAQWIKQNVNTTASLRGLSVVNEKVVWASGTGGTVIRTIDGGKTWKVMTVPGAETLDFRDVEAFDANTAYILSIGNGELSRIYKTTDGGKTWKEQFRNKNEKAFYDAMACWDRDNCIAMSDPVDGKFVLINTKDGGINWRPMDTDKMPPAKDGEAAFAASGTCLISQGKNNAFLVTGGSAARVFRSNNRGLTWFVADTPIVRGTAGSGIFSIAMSDSKNGVIVGGNYEKPNERELNYTATTSNGGISWVSQKDPVPFKTNDGNEWTMDIGTWGYRSSVAFLDNKTSIAVGTNGSDISRDGGKTWTVLSIVRKEDLNAVQSKSARATWAVGPKGLVVKLSDLYFVPPSEITNRYHWPVGNVERLSLSHQEISTSCAATNTTCSDERVIQLSVSAPAFDETLIEYVYVISGGKIVGEGANVEWDLSAEKPGTYIITAKACIPDTDPKWGCIGKTQTRQVVIR